MLLPLTAPFGPRMLCARPGLYAIHHTAHKIQICAPQADSQAAVESRQIGGSRTTLAETSTMLGDQRQ